MGGAVIEPRLESTYIWVSSKSSFYLIFNTLMFPQKQPEYLEPWGEHNPLGPTSNLHQICLWGNAWERERQRFFLYKSPGALKRVVEVRQAREQPRMEGTLSAPCLAIRGQILNSKASSFFLSPTCWVISRKRHLCLKIPELQYMSFFLNKN